MTAPPRRPRRRPGGSAGSQTLARLNGAREQLDAALVARRRREDELLTEYAVATDAVTDAEARREQALADLERRVAEIRAAAEQELAALEGRQGAVLVALHGDRTAEKLAQLVALPQHLTPWPGGLRHRSPGPPSAAAGAGGPGSCTLAANRKRPRGRGDADGHEQRNAMRLASSAGVSARRADRGCR